MAPSEARKELAKTPNAEALALLAKAYSFYAVSGQLDYIRDKALLANLAESAAGLRFIADNSEPVRKKLEPHVYDNLGALLEALKAKGVAVKGPDTMQGEVNLTATAQNGSKLFTAMIQADMDRAAAGSAGIWPKTGEAVEDDPKDISGREFKSATEYFTALLDGGVVKGIARDVVFDGGKSRWIIATDGGNFDPMPDFAPVLITANFDVANLRKAWTKDDPNSDKVLPVSGAGIVVVAKSGAVKKLPADKVTLREIYRNAPGFMEGWLPTRYLTPDGVVDLAK